MPRPPNYYDVLGVERDVDMRAIKRAWREAARTLHPDLPANRGNPQAKRRFALVKEAYETLSDPVRRQEYDERGSSPYMMPGSPFVDAHESARSTRHDSAEDIKLQTETGQGVADIFANLFGQGGHHQAPPKKSDSPWDPGRLHDEGMASRPRNQAPPPGGPRSTSRWGFNPEDLAEAALKGDMANADRMGEPPSNGGGRPRRPRRPAIPPERPGDPNWKPPGPAPTAAEPPPQVARAARPAPLRISAQVPLPVALCGGKHTITYRALAETGDYRMVDVDLFLPAATEDGAEVLLRGKGEGGADLLVTVSIEDHPIFRLRGRDLVMDLPLSPLEAASGCRIEVPTLQGSQRVSVPPGVRSGQKLRLRGLGAPSEGSLPAGNQELVLQILLPEPLTAEALDLLTQLDEASDWDPRAHWSRD